MSRLIVSVGLALLNLVFSAVVSASAPEDETGLSHIYGGEELVSLATGRRQPLSRAPAVATVITADEIKAMGATHLDEVLEAVPGLHVALSSNRFNPVYCIRGICTNFNPEVLLLVNGVPVTQLFLGDRGVRSTLPVESISRVEVIRGPGSAVYGADAFAGVINVVTKGASDINGTEIGARIGSFETREGWALHGGHWAGFDVAASIEYQETDDDRDRIIEEDAQTLFDRALGTRASLAPGPADTRQKRLDLRLDLSRDHWQFRLWNWRQVNLGVGPGVALALDPTGRVDIDNYLADLTYHRADLAKDWDVTAQMAYMDIDSESEQTLFPPGTVLPIDADGNVNPATRVGLVPFPQGLIGNPAVFERHARLDLSGFYTGFARHRVRLAAGYSYADLRPEESKNFGPGVIDGREPVVDGRLTDVTGTPFAFIDREHRRVYYASLQDEWSFAPDWDVTAGVRYDHYSDFGSTVNPRLALVWQTRHNISSKLLYGRAFRAPSFAELFLTNNPAALGNPDLKPENINTVELAVDYQPTFDLDTTLSVFHYDISNLIRFVAEPGGASQRAQNTGSQTGYGFELEARWSATDRLKLVGNYAFQRSRDEELGGDAGTAPHHQVYLRADWRFRPYWSLDSQLNWIGERKRVKGDPRADLEGYTTVDLTLRRKQAAGRFDLALSVRNLFDEDAREPSPADLTVPAGSLIPGDFPLPGRSVYGELRYRF